MIKCMSTGSELASRLFSGCVASVLEHNVSIEMKKWVNDFLTMKLAHGGKITNKEVDIFKIKWLAKINAIKGVLVKT